VIAVTVNGGHGQGGFGGDAAAPAFKDIALAALRLRDVPKDMPVETPSGGDVSDLAIASLEPSEAAGDEFSFASVVPSPQTSQAVKQPKEVCGLFQVETTKTKIPTSPAVNWRPALSYPISKARHCASCSSRRLESVSTLSLQAAVWRDPKVRRQASVSCLVKR